MDVQQEEKAVATSINAPEGLSKSVFRFGRYAVVRLLLLMLTVVVGLYVTLLAVNLGGRIDEVVREGIVFQAAVIVGADPAHKDKTAAERTQIARELAAQMEAQAGLDRHILLRTAEWLPRGLMLDLGESRSLQSISPLRASDRRNVRLLILERVPNTLLLMGVTNLLFFVTSVWAGLVLSRRYGGRLDKLFTALAPLSAAPGWFYGLFLVAIFAGILGWLPFGGMYPSPPPESRWLYGLGVMRHMILPFTAVFLSVFFYSVYTWRTFFLIYSGEDYVEMAQAKGLPASLISRRYILRPTLPTLLTNVLVTLIGIWSGSIILERLFNWPGLGDLYFLAIYRMETAVIVGLTVIYAYLLAGTIFLLDIAYALLDPRIRLGAGRDPQQQNGKVAAASGKKRLAFWPFRRREPETSHRARRGLALWSWPGRWLRGIGQALRQIPSHLATLGAFVWDLRRHPAALLGLLIILTLLGSIFYTVRAIPYQEAITLWRGGENVWQDSPRNARPAWVNYFSRTKLPETIVFDSRLGDGEKVVEARPGFQEVLITYTFSFPYDAFPQEPLIYVFPTYQEKIPQIEATWLTPDGRSIRLGQLPPRYAVLHRFSADTRLMRRLGGADPQIGLFADPEADTPTPLQGEYQLQIAAFLFEDDADFDAKFILHGQVHGWAGTDNQRRDLRIPLLWGVPIALSFGLLAALTTTFLTMVIAAVGAWRGGWVDDLIQRITEVNMILPLFPILAMFSAFFTLRIWEVLGLAIVLSIFGSSIKTYRALFLQVKEAPYIEAALAYGAGHRRIIRHYLVPRVLPVLIPQIMILVPTYVFLEAGLAFFGLSDLYLPTWGKVINDAQASSALLNGYYYWILQPAFLLMLTTFAFAMLGFTLDRIFNPRLREV